MVRDAHRSPAQQRTALAVAALLAFGGGCTPPATRTPPVAKRAYGGPVVSSDRIGILTPAREFRASAWRVAVLEINGVSKMGEWRTGSATEIYLAPGDYRFGVDFEQLTGNAGSAGLFDVLDDVSTAIEHRQATIAFTVRAGTVYRIHYRQHDQVYFVSTADRVVEDVPLLPPADAVECIANPDRSAPVWCAVVPAAD